MQNRKYKTHCITAKDNYFNAKFTNKERPREAKIFHLGVLPHSIFIYLQQLLGAKSRQSACLTGTWVSYVSGSCGGWHIIFGFDLSLILGDLSRSLLFFSIWVEFYVVSSFELHKPIQHFNSAIQVCCEYERLNNTDFRCVMSAYSCCVDLTVRGNGIVFSTQNSNCVLTMDPTWNEVTNFHM